MPKFRGKDPEDAVVFVWQKRRRKPKTKRGIFSHYKTSNNKALAVIVLISVEVSLNAHEVIADKKTDKIGSLSVFLCVAWFLCRKYKAFTMAILT